jgi:hypothetical protein
MKNDVKSFDLLPGSGRRPYPILTANTGKLPHRGNAAARFSPRSPLRALPKKSRENHRGGFAMPRAAA